MASKLDQELNQGGTTSAAGARYGQRTRVGSSVASVIVALGVGGQAAAQSKPGQLEEIIVTAEKREVVLSDVPISISVISGDNLRQFGITDFSSLGSLVPGLSGQIFEGSVQNRGPRTLGLRGIQSLSLTFFGSQNTVGFYINETPVSVVNPRLVDLERVEVLRGPQATLYGSSSLAGTIKLVTTQPKFEKTEAFVGAETSFTQDGGLNYAVEGSYNAPIGKAAAFRGSGYYESQDGYIDFREIDVFGDATGRTTKDANQNVSYGGMAALAFTPNESLTITPSIVFSHRKTDMADFFNAGRAVQYNHFPQDGSDEFVLTDLNIKWDVASGSINSNTAYFDMDSDALRDLTDLFGLSAAPNPALIPFENYITQKDFTHETRYASDFKGPYQVIGGVFYTNKEEVSGSFSDGTGIASIFGIPIPDNTILKSSFERKREELAFFGEASYEFTDKLKFVGGLRWFDVEYRNDDLATGIFPTQARGTASESDTIFKGRVEFRPVDGALIYGSVSEGYRMGGANPPLPSPLCDAGALAFYGTLPAPLAYSSDSLISYEIGGKWAPESKPVEVSAAVYYIDWQDPQIPVVLGGGCPLSGFVGNAGAAKSVGGELEISARPLDSWQVWMGVAYTNAEVAETLAYPGATVVIAEDGDPLPDIPKWTVSLMSDYRAPLTEGWEGYFLADYRYNDEQPADFSGTVYREAVNLVNLRIGAVSDTQLDVSLYVNNVFDDTPSLGPFTFGGTAGGGGRFNDYTLRPRTIGIAVRKHF